MTIQYSQLLLSESFKRVEEEVASAGSLGGPEAALVVPGRTTQFFQNSDRNVFFGGVQPLDCPPIRPNALVYFAR